MRDCTKPENYQDLVASARHCAGDGNCQACEYDTTLNCIRHLISDAAAAIEALQAEVGQWKAAVKGQEDGIKVLQTEVKRLKHEPKRVEFEKSLHEMFDSIWDCDINHPIFQDTVGELMEAVLQAYDTVNRAKMEVQE